MANAASGARRDRGQWRRELIVEFIRAKLAASGFPPTVREVGAAVGLRSSSTVHGHLMQLVSQGTIQMEPGLTRTIRIPRADPAGEGS